MDSLVGDSWFFFLILLLLQDRTHTANCCPQTPLEMDISETIVCDQPEIIQPGSDLMDSSSSTEEEFLFVEW